MTQARRPAFAREAGESRAALRALGRKPSWRNHAVVRALQQELAGLKVPSLESLLQPSSRHFIPGELCARLGLPGSDNAH